MMSINKRVQVLKHISSQNIVKISNNNIPDPDTEFWQRVDEVSKQYSQDELLRIGMKLKRGRPGERVLGADDYGK